MKWTHWGLVVVLSTVSFIHGAPAGHQKDNAPHHRTKKPDLEPRKMNLRTHRVAAVKLGTSSSSSQYKVEVRSAADCLAGDTILTASIKDHEGHSTRNARVRLVITEPRRPGARMQRRRRQKFVSRTNAAGEASFHVANAQQQKSSRCAIFISHPHLPREVQRVSCTDEFRSRVAACQPSMGHANAAAAVQHPPSNTMLTSAAPTDPQMLSIAPSAAPIASDDGMVGDDTANTNDDAGMSAPTPAPTASDSVSSTGAAAAASTFNDDGAAANPASSDDLTPAASDDMTYNDDAGMSAPTPAPTASDAMPSTSATAAPSTVNDDGVATSPPFGGGDDGYTGYDDDGTASMAPTPVPSAGAAAAAAAVDDQTTDDGYYYHDDAAPTSAPAVP